MLYKMAPTPSSAEQEVSAAFLVSSKDENGFHNEVPLLDPVAGHPSSRHADENHKATPDSHLGVCRCGM